MVSSKGYFQFELLEKHLTLRKDVEAWGIIDFEGSYQMWRAIIKELLIKNLWWYLVDNRADIIPDRGIFHSVILFPNH